MHKHFRSGPQPIAPILLMSITGILTMFFWEAHQGFSLWDEGYLWYGTQRVMAGEVPMRDFMAYDIGRYYWSAAVMCILGDNGIVALRVATTIFQGIALSIGLVVLARGSAKQSLLFWLLATITLLAWMAPQYRLFDISLPIILVGTLSYLVEKPSGRRYFLTGLIVGLAAVFGKNHGVYGLAGSLSAIAYLSIRRESGPSMIKALLTWLLGVAAGYLPVLVFLVVVPGFSSALWESVRNLFENKATNFPLPVPWPWMVPFNQLPFFEMLRGVTQGIFFVAICVFGLLGIIWAIRQKLQDKQASPALISSICLALPYAHYAFSRADLSHLAPGIPPFLMGVLALLVSQPTKVKLPLVALLCGASLLIMFPRHSGAYCYLTQKCVSTNIAGDELNVDLGTASNLAALNKLAERYANGDRTFIAVPFWPGAYAALGRRSPMWEIFIDFPQSQTFQQAEIERIKAANPGFAIINNRPLDGRDDLRFRNTLPLVYQYIIDNFEPLNGISQNPEVQVYISKKNN